jgi:DNA helicase-2/ATP-dependent DNA helicase PcrA
LNGVNDFIQQQSEIFEGDNSLSKYLQDVALYSETDKDIHSEKVSLMSIHMAKGLEFPIVYVVGLEENLFPSIMSINSREEIEEERRLFYVAMTREKEKLILSHCEQRFKWGNIIDCEPSRFIGEVDEKFLQRNNTNKNYIRQKINENKLRLKKIPNRSFKKIKTNAISSLKKYKINLNINDKVYHDRFGEGKVIEIEGEGDNIRANINFKINGEKKILLKFAKLKILK